MRRHRAETSGGARHRAHSRLTPSSIWSTRRRPASPASPEAAIPAINVFADFADRVRRVVAPIAAGTPAAQAVATLLVEPPRDPAHGDLASNAAMLLAKP